MLKNRQSDLQLIYADFKKWFIDETELEMTITKFSATKFIKLKELYKKRIKDLEKLPEKPIWRKKRRINALAIEISKALKIYPFSCALTNSQKKAFARYQKISQNEKKKWYLPEVCNEN